MRKGMQGLSLLVQESFGRDPFAGDVFVFRGRSGSLIEAAEHPVHDKLLPWNWRAAIRNVDQAA
jgi:hypothetical protein